MTESGDETRTIVTLSVGARVGVVLALLLLIVAGYLFWSPIQLSPSAGGFPVKCGSAANPPGDQLGAAACGQSNVIRQWQAGAFLAAALVVAIGSLYAFGVRAVRARVQHLPGARRRKPGQDED